VGRLIDKWEHIQGIDYDGKVAWAAENAIVNATNNNKFICPVSGVRYVFKKFTLTYGGLGKLSIQS
jgi:hypothetical protein